MSRLIEIEEKARIYNENDDLITQLYNSLQEKENVYARLEQIRKERKVINSDIIKFLLELKEFKKYIHEESYKINDYIETINECLNIIDDERTKQRKCQKTLETIKTNTERLRSIANLAKIRIANYRPYEEFISKVIIKNPRYETVFDIIKHVGEMACIRKLVSTLKFQEFDSDDENNNTAMKNTNKRTNVHSSKITLRTDFNDPRTNLNDIKMTDLAYIKEKTGVTSDDGIPLNRVNPINLKTDLERMKDSRVAMAIEVFIQGIKDKQEENLLVISSIFHQYRELYFKINGVLPTVFPLADGQLTYIFDYYKTTVKRLDIYKNLKSGTMTKEDYILKAKELT